MNKAIVFVVLVVGLAQAQLNYEGNPLTENTEYTAQESRFSQRTARQEEAATNAANRVTERPQKLYRATETVATLRTSAPGKSAIESDRIVGYAEDSTKSNDLDNAVPIARARNIVVETPRILADTSNREANSLHRSELALSTFLNSRTPEESRLSLDHYLQTSGTSPTKSLPEISRDHPSDRSAVVEPTSMLSASSQQITPQPMQLQSYPNVNQGQQFSQPTNQFYDPAVNPQHPQTLPNARVADPGMQQQQTLPQSPYGFGIQARNDMIHPSGWYNRVRRIRKPMPFPQSRVGPGVYNGHFPGPFKHKGPIEVIYTKPPGFHRGPPPIANPPVPYEDASAWFPEVDQPPPSKDVYYSQLYAQSYDPHYYNYIAKTGKIKPHLYGKLGKYHNDESGGIWAELFSGFKKHGLKNMMNPTFLLGMTLPIVTLMLSALVQKRSLSRSSSGSREFSNREDTLQEYLERLQRAMECYGKTRRKRDADIDDCSSKERK